ncbi:MAG: methyltransferase domain-containing protein [Acidobacteria bacterium]|nr:methyltransferase domain-containing protein [Acidobacteriota bacterium]
MTRQQIQEAIVQLGPWFYSFDLGDGLRTPSVLPPEVAEIHSTRLEMIGRFLESHFGSRLAQISCLDVGCHEGFYAVEMAKKGIPRVLGLDVREDSLAKGRLVAEVLGLPQVCFRAGDCEQLRAEEVGQHELTLFLGVLYHLENPMRCLRNISQVTQEVCIVETQVIDEVEGLTEWGAREWTRPYQGVLAVIDESDELAAGNTETGSTPVALAPSPKALAFLLRQAGFRRTEILPPPPHAYEQHARRKRVVCVAYK